jgi:hypothetical protein
MLAPGEKPSKLKTDLQVETPSKSGENPTNIEQSR